MACGRYREHLLEKVSLMETLSWQTQLRPLPASKVWDDVASSVLTFWAVVTFLLLTRVSFAESNSLAKPSFSQNYCSSNLQEKEEDRIPPILFSADYFPFGINELPAGRPSCSAQITSWTFACGSQPFRDRVLPMAKKKKGHSWMETEVRLEFLSKFICPLLTGEFPVKRFMFSQDISHVDVQLKCLPGWPVF